MGGVDGMAEAVGVVDGAEVEDVGEVAPGDGEVAGGGTGGEEEGVEGDFLAVVEADGMAAQSSWATRRWVRRSMSWARYQAGSWVKRSSWGRLPRR